MKNKKTVIVLSILTMIVTIMGGTLAYFSWTTSESQKTNVTFTVTSNFSCAADGGGSITSNDVKLAPATCTNSTYAIKRTVTVTPTITRPGLDIYMDLWLNVVDIDDKLSETEYFSYALTKSSTSCEGEGAITGTFKGLKDGDKVPLLNQKVYSSSTPDTYYLYIWLDKDEEDPSTMDKNFTLSLGGTCSDTQSSSSGDTYTEEILNGTDPELLTGMIPVTISDTGAVTTADTSAQWYSYENKQWANAVLVKKDADTSVTGSKSRQYYIDNPGEPVLESDILAYYVWIPRYKYTFPKADGNPELISIVFEDKDTAKSIPSTGKASGTDYYTHPAFTFGENNELNGIWVGKFETGHSTLSSSTTDNKLACTTENCANADGLIIKPNVTSLRRNSISNMFYASRSMSKSNNPFGLDATTSNTHMLKNSEWGAIAYLSHSVYGKGNVEITRNSNSSYITGAGNGTTYFSFQAGTYTHPQSTTGNISGVFDISGGVYEYVMGNYNGTTNTYFATLPDSKYYDMYPSSQFNESYSTNVDKCDLATCGGHALHETKSWYDDYASFVSSYSPWFIRGGYYGNGSGAGAFVLNGGFGGADSGYGFRSAVIKGA